MDPRRLSKHFHQFRESSDWKAFEVALEKILHSPACAAFTRAVAPAAQEMELGEFFDLLAGFVRWAEIPPDASLMKVVYREDYEPHNDRPTMTLQEEQVGCTILIGGKSFQQEIQLFDVERGTMKLRFGRAKLDGISHLNDLNAAGAPTFHRILLDQARTPLPIVFFNVVTETEKYTGERTTFADFYILG